MSMTSEPDLVVETAGFIHQHDGNAFTDGISQAGLGADQLLRRAVVFQRPLGQGADQYFQQLRIDTIRLPLRSNERVVWIFSPMVI